jgi:hypothetical protein
LTAAPTRRLRPVGRPEALEPLPRAQRVTHQRPVIAWLALGERDATRAALIDAVDGLDAVLVRVMVRTTPGTQPLTHDGIVDGIAASPDALPAAIGTMLAALPLHRLVLIEGAAALTHVHARLSMIVTAGQLPMAWPAEVRAVRSEIDLAWPAVRPAALRRIVTRLAG